MHENSNVLRDHINGLSDEELVAIVTVDRAQYREEALAFAAAELRRRGVRARDRSQDDASAAPSSFWGEPGWGETPPQAGAESEESAEAEDPEDPEDSEEAGAGEAEAGPEEPDAAWGEGEFWQEPRASVAFRIFRSTFTSWEELFQQAADFAAEVGPERVISISHSADRGDGVVTVWYRA